MNSTMTVMQWKRKISQLSFLSGVWPVETVLLDPFAEDLVYKINYTTMIYKILDKKLFQDLL
jgi:hypothetical protein